jgi:hypothetical protein
MGDPEWPKSAYGFGGKYAYQDDQETPNTLVAGFNYGDRELVFEVRGLLTGGEGTPARRMGPGGGGRGGRGAAPAAAPPDAPAPAAVGPASNPLNVQVGDLFYGTEGWAAMSDQGFQAYKGESSEIIMEERPERGQPGGDATGLHMQNFLQACKSRNAKDLHDPLSNAVHSANLCHLANISYRSGRKLTLEAGPKFTGDAEATKMLARDVYRKPYIV